MHASFPGVKLTYGEMLDSLYKRIARLPGVVLLDVWVVGSVCSEILFPKTDLFSDPSQEIDLSDIDLKFFIQISNSNRFDLLRNLLIDEYYERQPQDTNHLLSWNETYQYLKKQKKITPANSACGDCWALHAMQLPNGPRVEYIWVVKQSRGWVCSNDSFGISMLKKTTSGKPIAICQYGNFERAAKDYGKNVIRTKRLGDVRQGLTKYVDYITKTATAEDAELETIFFNQFAQEVPIDCLARTIHSYLDSHYEKDPVGGVLYLTNFLAIYRNHPSINEVVPHILPYISAPDPQCDILIWQYTNILREYPNEWMTTMACLNFVLCRNHHQVQSCPSLQAQSTLSLQAVFHRNQTYVRASLIRESKRDVCFMMNGSMLSTFHELAIRWPMQQAYPFSLDYLKQLHLFIATTLGSSSCQTAENTLEDGDFSIAVIKRLIECVEEDFRKSSLGPLLDRLIHMRDFYRIVLHHFPSLARSLETQANHLQLNCRIKNCFLPSTIHDANKNDPFFFYTGFNETGLLDLLKRPFSPAMTELLAQQVESSQSRSSAAKTLYLRLSNCRQVNLGLCSMQWLSMDLSQEGWAYHLQMLEQTIQRIAVFDDSFYELIGSKLIWMLQILDPSLDLHQHCLLLLPSYLSIPDTQEDLSRHLAAVIRFLERCAAQEKPFLRPLINTLASWGQRDHLDANLAYKEYILALAGTGDEQMLSIALFKYNEALRRAEQGSLEEDELFMEKYLAALYQSPNQEHVSYAAGLSSAYPSFSKQKSQNKAAEDSPCKNDDLGAENEPLNAASDDSQPAPSKKIDKPDTNTAKEPLRKSTPEKKETSRSSSHAKRLARVNRLSTSGKQGKSNRTADASSVPASDDHVENSFNETELLQALDKLPASPTKDPSQLALVHHALELFEASKVILDKPEYLEKKNAAYASLLDGLIASQYPELLLKACWLLETLPSGVWIHAHLPINVILQRVHVLAVLEKNAKDHPEHSILLKQLSLFVDMISAPLMQHCQDIASMQPCLELLELLVEADDLCLLKKANAIFLEAKKNLDGPSDLKNMQAAQDVPAIYPGVAEGYNLLIKGFARCKNNTETKTVLYARLLLNKAQQENVYTDSTALEIEAARSVLDALINSSLISHLQPAVELLNRFRLQKQLEESQQAELGAKIINQWVLITTPDQILEALKTMQGDFDECLNSAPHKRLELYALLIHAASKTKDAKVLEEAVQFLYKKRNFYTASPGQEVNLLFELIGCAVRLNNTAYNPELLRTVIFYHRHILTQYPQLLASASTLAKTPEIKKRERFQKSCSSRLVEISLASSDCNVVSAAQHLLQDAVETQYFSAQHKKVIELCQKSIEKLCTLDEQAYDEALCAMLFAQKNIFHHVKEARYLSFKPIFQKGIDATIQLKTDRFVLIIRHLLSTDRALYHDEEIAKCYHAFLIGLLSQERRSFSEMAAEIYQTAKEEEIFIHYRHLSVPIEVKIVQAGLQPTSNTSNQMRRAPVHDFVVVKMPSKADKDQQK